MPLNPRFLTKAVAEEANVALLKAILSGLAKLLKNV
jgi:hypothetical protein